MSEDKKEDYKKLAIIEELRGKPNYNEEVCKLLNKVMSRQTFFNLRNQLVLAGKVMRKEWGRRVILHLPEDEELMKQFMKEQVAQKHITLVGEDFKYESRKKHTKDLKKEVIEPWLNQLPAISVTEGIRVTISTSDNISVDVPYGDWLPVEKEPLFCDFKNHIRFSPNPFDELEKFKKKAKSFHERRYNLERKVLSIIDAEMEFHTICKMLGNAISETEKSKMSKEFDEQISISARLLSWVLEKLECFYPTKWDEIWFKDLFLEFDSYVRGRGYFYKYYIIESKPLYCGRIEKEKKEKDEFQREIDEKIKKMLKKVGKSESLRNAVTDLKKIEEELDNYLVNIEAALEKHKRLIILPGDCEYLRI